MSTISRILAATDFSDAGRRATQRAVRLARQGSLPLQLLHVISPASLGVWQRLTQRADDHDLRSEAEARLGQLLADCGDLAADIPAHIRIDEGNVGDGIAGAAAALDHVLLVLGARGESTLRDLLLGSTTEQVLRKSDRSLLAVRADADRDYRQVLVPVDFSPHARGALEIAAQLAPAAAITVLHVFDAPIEGKLEFAGVPAADIEAYRQRGQREAESMLHAFIQDMPPAIRNRVVPDVTFGYPAITILEKATALGCDLLAIGKHGRSVVEEWVLGSVTQHVLRHARCDVLAAHHHG
ncbi:MAG: universal stress protein [Gammaproteobacteria bacterium]